MNAFANLLNSLGLWAALPLALLLGLLTWGAARLCALLWEDRLAPSAEAAAVGFHAVLATLVLLLVLTLVQASTVWREAHARTAREAAGMTALDRSLLSFAGKILKTEPSDCSDLLSHAELFGEMLAEASKIR